MQVNWDTYLNVKVSQFTWIQSQDSILWYGCSLREDVNPRMSVIIVAVASAGEAVRKVVSETFP